jgi:hypothetical protein
MACNLLFSCFLKCTIIGITGTRTGTCTLIVYDSVPVSSSSNSPVKFPTGKRWNPFDLEKTV